MGRNKGQRTKNNARPSNSSRSAELLGAAAPSFIGFTTAKNEEYASFTPGFSITSSAELPSTFQMVFKKMNKKNATTKFKALQELTHLCSNANLTEVENMLSFWPRYYSSLSIDVNHRVREAVQLAHATILKRVGKGIATYLKELAGPWFVAQYDSYPPVASAAYNSFNDTFPPQKFVHAIVHCQDEILNYICDNIIVLNPQTLSTNNSLTSEEIETQYQRLVASSLQAYTFYLKTVKTSDIEKTIEYHKKLIGSAKFWKFAKNEISLIKTACFGTLTGLLCHAYDIVFEEKKKLLTTAINSLDETEPALLIAVWECFLTAMNKIEDWHKVVSLEKLVLPKLWRVLRNGGQNCASIVYPHLLPFLSHFTKFEINKTTLFTNFFENMRQGFSAKSVKLSRSETTIVVTSFFECFRYVILINSQNEDICKCLLKNQLMYMVESCINEQSMRSNFFNQLNSLIRYWNKNSDNPDYPTYAKLLKIFWFELMAIFNRLVDDSNNNHNITTNFIIGSMAELLLYLNSEPCNDRRNMKVTFWDSQIESSEQSPSIPLLVTNTNDAAFLKQVEQFVIKLCISYFKRIVDKRKIIDLVKIVTIHESNELLMALAKTYDENATLLDFYNQYIRILQTDVNVQKEDLINFIFIIMTYMSDFEKNVVLHAFLEVDDVKILKIAVQFALTEKYREDTVIKKWFKQDVITNTLVLIAQEVLSTLEIADSDEKLFLKAFKPALDKDLIVSNEAICGILSIFCLMVDRLPWNNEKQAERITYLLCELLTLSWTHREINMSAIKLLRALFGLLLIDDSTEQSETEIDSPIKKIVQKTWTTGLYEIKSKMPSDVYDENIKYFTSVIWKKMLSKDYANNSLNVNEPLIDLSVNFVETIIKIDQMKSNEFINNFIMESEVKDMMKYITSSVLQEEVIIGNLYVPNLILEGCVCNESFNIDLCNTYIEKDVNKCFKWALYSIKILNKLLKQLPEILNISEIFINIFYVAALPELYIEHNILPKQLSNIGILNRDLKVFLKDLGQYLSNDFHNKIMSILIKLLLSFGGIYQYILKFYYTTFKDHIDFCKLIINKDSSLVKKSNDEISLQAMQILWDCEIYKNVKKYLPSNKDSSFNKIFVARNQLEDKELLEEVFDDITKIQKNKPLTLLLDCDIHEMSWKDFTLSLEIISFFKKCIITIPQELSISKWGVIEICLASWNLSIKRSLDYIEDFKVKSLVIAINKLYTSIQMTMNKKNVDSSLLNEWKELFANELQSGIFEIWIKLAELYHEKKDLPITCTIPLKYIGISLTYFDNLIIKKDTSENENENQSENRTIELLLKLLYSPVQSLQIGTFIILNNIVDVLVKRDEIIIEMENFSSKLLNICKFEQILRTSQTIVNTMLMEFKLCDTISCTIQPYTDSYTYTINYLYSWIIVLNMCAKANRDLRYQYAEILKNDLFSNLLNNIFRLIPGDEIYQKNSHNLDFLFSTEPSSNFTESWTEQKIEHLVCYIYKMCLKYLPVLVRQWLSIIDSRIQAAVDKITTVYVSPLLLKEELECDTPKHVDNMQIEKNQHRREIVALYNLDDTKLELIITFPLNYPLCPVTVEPGQHIGGMPNQRNCHMQLSIFLKHQNGTIWDGIMLWKANLDKKFAGVEECYICFSIFHISSYQIPKLSCHTCRKKFHASCLYKWFNRSYKSTCPLCRNAFPF